MICKKCSNNIPDTAIFCPKCGTKVEIVNIAQKVVESPKEKHGDVNICPKCGTSYPSTAKFCNKDGTSLQKVSPTQKEEDKPPEVTKEKEAKEEAVFEPITPAVTAEPKAEEKPPEITPELKTPIDMIICPTCGTQNPLTSKFCKKDGTPLKQKIKPEAIVETKQTQITPEFKSVDKVPEKEIAIEKPKIETSLMEEEKPAPIADIGMKPEIVDRPVIPEVTNEIKAEEKLPIKTPEIEKPHNMITCPRCGTQNPLTAKFCKKDGVPLKEEPKTTEPKEVKPRVILEPKPTEVIAEPKEVERPLEKIVELEKRKVEAPLKEEIKPPAVEKKEIKPEISVQPKIKETVRLETVVKKEAERRPSKPWMWLTILGLVIILAGVGSYLYFSSKIGKKPSEITTAPEVSKPAEPIKLPGEGPKPPETPQVPQKVEPGIEKPVSPEPKSEVLKPSIPKPGTPSVDIGKLEREVNRSLRNRGLNDIYAEVNKDLVATLIGTAKNQEEKNGAASIVRSHREIKEVRDNIQIKEVKLPPPPPPSAPKVDPAKLEGDINRSLRNNGVKGVTAEVSDDLQVTLKGTVTSASDKGRAFEIAKTFKDVKSVRDMIFVVEQ